MASDHPHPVREAGDARVRRDLDLLLTLLVDVDIVARRTAAYNLGKMADARAVPNLVRCLHASDELLRSTASAALGEIGDPSCIAVLYEVATDDESLRVRTTAVESLIELGDPRVADLLGGLIREDGRPFPRTFRKWVCRKMVEVGATTALPDLRAVAETVGPLERAHLLRAIKTLERLEGQLPAPRNGVDK
jgi:HEAT repeat protein